MTEASWRVVAAGLLDRAVQAEMQRDELLRVLRRIAASQLYDLDTIHPDSCPRVAREAIAKIEGEK